MHALHLQGHAVALQQIIRVYDKVKKFLYEFSVVLAKLET